MTESPIGRQERQCHRIVDDRLNAATCEVGCEIIAPLVTHDVQMPHVLRALPDEGQLQPIDARKNRGVLPGDLLTATRPARQMRQLYAQHSRLKTIEPAVDAFDL